jgi:hypothetical protein
MKTINFKDITSKVEAAASKFGFQVGAFSNQFFGTSNAFTLEVRSRMSWTGVPIPQVRYSSEYPNCLLKNFQEILKGA